ncbi:CPBP family intramembrane glutamic endopeptidase [Synechococcus sp. RedBA-s]|uniref:CPBP family intramembrane glutamic endopeptidase n=1 Tax=Synechococcus sp. RedBA-s TaxID=2823741 RepID=UPI0028F45A55|nr:CPBP family intramembrane glutamic endopeptidase [Synechococcus sp. RedBA-s]
MPRRAWLGWISTLLYLPLLYGLGWLTLQPFAAAGLFSDWRPDQVNLLGTGLAFALLLVTLPLRLGQVWGERRPWRALGIAVGWSVGLRSLLRGLLKALLLLLFVAGLLLISGQARWSGGLTPAEMVNAVLLILGVGIAEELVFRGWLWGELSQRLGGGAQADQRALIAQAAVFSLAHTRFNLGIAPMAGLLVGLLLLGLVFPAVRATSDRAHGADLAGWPRRRRSQSDRWAAGLGRTGRPALGEAALLVNRHQRTAVAKARRPSTGACRASSSGARP